MSSSLSSYFVENPSAQLPHGEIASIGIPHFLNHELVKSPLLFNS